MRFDLGRKAAAALALASALALGGCYDGYGYGGVSAGYGYNDPGLYGSPYGYGGIGPGYGWNDGFYYPGSGYYVYDRGGARHRWNDGQRRYWEGRRAGYADGRWNGRRDGRWDGRRDGRWNGSRDGRWAGRPGDGRPGGGWRGSDGATRPPIIRPGGSGNDARPDRGGGREASRAARGQGVWGAFPRAGRAVGGERGGRMGRGNVRP